MTLSPDRIRHLATLARLELSEAEADAVAGELRAILQHLAALRRGAGWGAEPPDEGTGPVAPLRPDRVGFDPLRVPPAELAPAWEEGFFVVPRLPALDAEGGGEAG